MSMIDIPVQRSIPEPWREGAGLPYSDPGLSERMLRMQLSQDHDRGSRRNEVLDQQVSWIHMNSRPGMRVLDLACGPGLYTSRMARLGHSCVGIDCAPAAVHYARGSAKAGALDCRYVLGDVREEVLGSDFDLVLLFFGFLNLLEHENSARSLLAKARAALVPGGCLLIELLTAEAVEAMGNQARTWSSHSTGLFSEERHLLLHEYFWLAERRTTIRRVFVVDAETGSTTTYTESVQAYSTEQLTELLIEVGFVDVDVDVAFTGPDDRLRAARAKRPL